jgi:type I restriction enzyme, S subunit
VSIERASARPTGWGHTAVGDIVETIQYGHTASAKPSGGGPKFLRITDIQDGAVDWSHVPVCDIANGSLEKYRLDRGDIVFARTGATTGKSYVIRDCPGSTIFASYLIRLRVSRGIEPHFLWYFFQTSDYWRQIETKSAGIAQPGVNATKLATLRLPIATSLEQPRIVAAIDSYLTRLDAALASLERAQAKLKAYRVSVVKAAVEGRLVSTEASLARAEKRDYEPAEVLLARILKERRRRWEEAEVAKLRAAGKTPKDDKWKAKYQDPATPDTSTLSALPEGWCWARLDAVSDVILGQQRSPVHAAAEMTAPYIRAANITWAGLDLSDVKRMGFVNPERHRLHSGDVLLSEASGSPMEAGKPAIWRNEIPGACFQNTVIRVRPLDKAAILPEFLRLVFLRDCVTGHFARLAPGVGIVHIGAERLAQWSVPLASLPEQRRIVEEVERVLSVTDQNAVNVERDVRRCARLRQAVLKWAFEGKLVDQDPSDEPADKLLARIRAERAAAAPRLKQRGRTARGKA